MYVSVVYAGINLADPHISPLPVLIPDESERAAVHGFHSTQLAQSLLSNASIIRNKIVPNEFRLYNWVSVSMTDSHCNSDISDLSLYYSHRT